MIERLRITNFQSLHEVDVELGKLTVLTGPSSSGKSALLRAVRVLARNSAGTGFVTSSRRTAVIRATLAQGPTVVLERGPGKSEYAIYTEGDESRFGKAGTDTPEAIKAALNLLETDDGLANIAGQFDKPFMLDEPATKVAKTLGTLTNIDVLMDAVREANRRRLDTNQRLKIRTLDVEKAKTDIQQFADLKPRKERLEKAEALLEQARTIRNKLHRLRETLDANSSLRGIQSQLRAHRPEVPDLKEIELKVERLSRLGAAIAAIRRDSATRDQLFEELDTLERTASDCETRVNDVLREAGVCPLCGHKTRENDHV